MTDDSATVSVELENVWKIFGRQSGEALRAMQLGEVSKRDVLERYDAVVGVQDVSLRILKGELFCIMGLSGSGKSTLVRHVNRLIEPTSGTVKIDGKSIDALDAKALRELRAGRIGMVFQNMALLPHRSVRDNIAFALELRGTDAKTRFEISESVLRQVSLQGYGDRMPSELSGGMQQRVGLGRALAANPDILLMDEPFSALDPLIRKGLQSEFLSLSRELRKTTLFITHDLDEAIRMGNRIAIMKDGIIVQVGTPAEIVTSPVDGYVSEFVEGISKLKFLFAKDLMEPIGRYETEYGPLPEVQHCPSATPNDDLAHLIRLSVGQKCPTVVFEDRQPIGVVTKDALLRGVQGEA